MASADESGHVRQHHEALGRHVLGPKHIAPHLDVSERHVRDIRREDETFPPPRMVGSKPRRSPDVIRRWVADGGGPTRPPAGPTRVQEWLGCPWCA